MKRTVIMMALITCSVAIAQPQAIQSHQSQERRSKPKPFKKRADIKPPIEAQKPAITAKPTSLVDDCIHGAGNAVTAAAVVTGIGCVLDVFLTGGALCATYLAAAATHIPVTVSAGCAIGAIATPLSAAPYGASDAAHALIGP